jgi:predicted Zn-dependent peptidase
MEKFDCGTSGRLRLHVLPTKRFKTFAIALYAGVPLTESGVTPTALTPFVLRRGTQTYPETIAFRERLDELYGAGFGFDLTKRGNYQIVSFRMDVINDRFVATDDSLLAAALRFLGEVVTRPALENGVFLSRYVDTEKSTLTNRMDAIINDKIRYASERCLAEMCKDEPYRLPAVGLKNDLPRIDPASLHAHYQRWLAEAALDLYVVGDTTLDEVQALVGEAFHFPSGSPAAYARAEIRPAGGEVRRIVERLDVNQGKLNMGLRTGTPFGSANFFPLLLYNGLLGAYPHSKLFRNVREKASLAYYASSRLDAHKGILTIQTGIEIPNYDKTVAIVLEQLEEMKQGQFAAEDVARTKAMLANQLTEIGDTAFERIGFDFNNVLADEAPTVEQWIEGIHAVTTDQIVEAASRIQLDTIYFLRDGKDREGGV